MLGIDSPADVLKRIDDRPLRMVGMQLVIAKQQMVTGRQVDDRGVVVVIAGDAGVVAVGRRRGNETTSRKLRLFQHNWWYKMICRIK